MGQPEPGSPANRRSARTGFRPERKTPSSKHRKWARKKDAAEGSRRGHRRREKGHNPRRPVDFEAHEQQRANGKSPMVERQTSVNRSSCGRRTSLGAARFNAWPHARLATRCLADSILGPRRRFHAYLRSRVDRCALICNHESRAHHQVFDRMISYLQVRGFPPFRPKRRKDGARKMVHKQTVKDLGTC
jgi:hypothetical protein